MNQIIIKHSSSNGREYGYGLYINAIINGEIYASECIDKNANRDEIRASEKRVRAKARREYKKIGN